MEKYLEKIYFALFEKNYIYLLNDHRIYIYVCVCVCVCAITVSEKYKIRRTNTESQNLIDMLETKGN